MRVLSDPAQPSADHGALESEVQRLTFQHKVLGSHILEGGNVGDTQQWLPFEVFMPAVAGGGGVTVLVFI